MITFWIIMLLCSIVLCYYVVLHCTTYSIFVWTVFSFTFAKLCYSAINFDSEKSKLSVMIVQRREQFVEK